MVTKALLGEKQRQIESQSEIQNSRDKPYNRKDNQIPDQQVSESTFQMYQNTKRLITHSFPMQISFLFLQGENTKTRKKQKSKFTKSSKTCDPTQIKPQSL